MFSNLFPPVVSGSSTQSFALARELAARGHRVAVITAHTHPDTPTHEVVHGVEVHRLPSIRLPKAGIYLHFPWLHWTFTPRNVRRAAAIVAAMKPDVLHLHNHMFDLAFTATRMRRRFKIPLVVTIHTQIKHAQPLYNVLLYPADRIFLRVAVIRHADAIISPDVNMAAYCEDAWNRTETALVPYGISIPPAPTPAEQAALRQKYDVEGRRVLLSLGHVHENRNRRDLIDAMPHILAKHPDAVLLIAGSEDTPAPRRRVTELGIEHAVKFAGAIPHTDVSGLIAVAELEAHWLNVDVPERTSLGIASLEAMLGGRPVLAAANPDTYGPGVIEDGRNIVLVRPGEPEELATAINELLDDPARRGALGDAARATIQENFLWDSVTAKTEAVYESVITTEDAQ